MINLICAILLHINGYAMSLPPKAQDLVNNGTDIVNESIGEPCWWQNKEYKK